MEVKVYYRRDGSISATRNYINDLYDRDRLYIQEIKLINCLPPLSRSNVIFGEMTDRFANGNIEIIYNRHYTSDGDKYDFGIWQYFDLKGKLLEVMDFGNPIPCEFSNKKYFEYKIKEIERQRREFKDLLINLHIKNCLINYTDIDKGLYYMSNIYTPDIQNKYDCIALEFI